MCTQSREIRCGHHSELEILSEVMGDAVSAVEPGSAHRASLTLSLSEHKVIDNERSIGLGEEFAQSDAAHWRITSLEVARTLLKLIVLKRSAVRKMPPHLSHAFTLAHEFDFSEAKLFALGKIFGRFVGQIGLTKCSVDYCVYQDLDSSSSFSRQQHEDAIDGILMIHQRHRSEF